ncbi:MAG: hypothetical protein HZC55_04955 [Verrucomicrobia bacterium]|nr:hypothetical protein [Verrucomicrobiota bacterium]
MSNVPETGAPGRPGEGGMPGLAGWEWLAGVGATLLAGALLLEPGFNFHYDWHNHQWMVGYVGEFLRAQGRLPEVLHTPAAVGMPQPIFYGFLLYPILGGLSAVTGAALALRLAVAVALLGQYFSVYLAARNAARHRGVALAVALAVTWSVHGLTNLYNRAALTEFFAVALLHGAVACGVLGVCGRTAAGRRLAGWLAVLQGTLVAGTHPPTALLATPLLGVLAVLGWRELGPGARERRWFLVAAGLGVLTLAPWIDANLRWRGELGVVGKYRDFSYSLDRVDALWARLSPLPPDVFRAEAGAPGETPYVEAPVHVVLVLLAGWCLVRARGDAITPSREEGSRFLLGLAVCGAACFVFATAASVSPSVGTTVRGLAPYVQFATRWVGVANVGLLLGVLGVAGWWAGQGAGGRRPRETVGVIVVLMALTGAGVGLKLRHGAAVREPGGESQYAVTGDRAALVTAGKADAAGDYATLRRLPQLAPAVASRAARPTLPVGAAGRNFGEVGSVVFGLPEAGWVATNVVVFPWNRVLVDGAEVPKEHRAAHDYRLALRLPAGSHRLSWVWEPDARARILRLLAQLSFAGLTLGAIVLVVRAKRDRRGPVATTPVR